MKDFRLIPEVGLQELVKKGLDDKIQMNAIGGLNIAILILTPRTSFLGILVGGSYLGDAICLHMSHQAPYVVQLAFVPLTWVGTILRHPSAFQPMLKSVPSPLDLINSTGGGSLPRTREALRQKS